MKRMCIASFVMTLTAMAFATPELKAATPPVWPDGIPNAPDSVYTNTGNNGLGVLLHTAASEQKVWHAATDGEKKLVHELFAAINTDLIDGPSTANSAVILQKANALLLQVCRVVKESDDPYLMFWAKNGVHDCTSSFFTIRENGSYCSRICILSPHDFSDGTWSSTKIGFDESHAFAMMCSGHPKGIAGSNISDWCHSEKDLGFTVFKGINDLEVDNLAENQPIFVMVHGKAANNRHFLERGRHEETERAFVTTVEHLTGWTVEPLNAYMVEQSKINGDRWLVTELPSARLSNNSQLVAHIVQGMEAKNADGSYRWPHIWLPGLGP